MYIKALSAQTRSPLWPPILLQDLIAPANTVATLRTIPREENLLTNLYNKNYMLKYKRISSINKNYEYHFINLQNPDFRFVNLRVRFSNYLLTLHSSMHSQVNQLQSFTLKLLNIYHIDHNTNKNIFA